MQQALRTLRAVQWSMLASILLYAAVGELANPRARGPDPTLSYIFSTLSVGIVGTIFVVRRTLVQRAAVSLASHPDDGLSLNHWKSGYIATYALCEALALFGLVLRFRGSQLEQSLLFYIGAFVLILFFRAREPVASSTAT
jgi:cytochrome b561